MSAQSLEQRIPHKVLQFLSRWFRRKSDPEVQFLRSLSLPVFTDLRRVVCSTRDGFVHNTGGKINMYLDHELSSDAQIMIYVVAGSFSQDVVTREINLAAMNAARSFAVATFGVGFLANGLAHEGTKITLPSGCEVVMWAAPTGDTLGNVGRSYEGQGLTVMKRIFKTHGALH